MDNPWIMIAGAVIVLVLLIVFLLTRRKKTTPDAAAEDGVQATVSASKAKSRKSSQTQRAASKTAQNNKASSGEEVEVGAAGEKEEQDQEVFELAEVGWESGQVAEVSVTEVDDLTEYKVYKQFGYYDKAAESLSKYLSGRDNKPKDLVLELFGLYLESGQIDELVQHLELFGSILEHQELEEVVKIAFELDPNNLSLRVYSEKELGWGVDEVEENIVQSSVAEDAAVDSEDKVEAFIDSVVENQFVVSSSRLNKLSYFRKLADAEPLVVGYRKIKDIDVEERDTVTSFSSQDRAARLLGNEVTYQQAVLLYNRDHPFVMQMNQCPNLPEHVSQLIEPLKNMIGQLDCYDQIAQIECAVGESVTVMVLRNMVTLSNKDEKVIQGFVDQYQSTAHPLQIWLQPEKEDSMAAFYPLNMPKLHYGLPEFDLNMPFHPAEFTQVNPAVNQLMVARAVRLLAIKPQDRVVDFFCGLGNFSLAIAKKGAKVLGVEGSLALVKRAEENAKLNQLAERCQFIEANLFKQEAVRIDEWCQYDKWLIDPPRDGACTLLEALPEDGARPGRIVYISCKPSTLARDAGILNQKGYRLKMAGVMNMFAHTTHVESIAVFETK